MQKEKFYITTAIAYASRKPHFGNTYEIIMSDAFARFQKRLGKDVFLCTGTDEHGQKIENLANEAGISPKAYVDGVAAEINVLSAGALIACHGVTHDDLIGVAKVRLARCIRDGCCQIVLFTH
ncbi:MAG: class I tRNA ligase family protein, partial [Clostridia bacterium]|nr:class I tRNA ligase family protein [Clostridia bacterium]